jgi:hypothetical protein
MPFAVSDHYKGAETEVPAAFDHFRTAVDTYYPLVKT